jgi:hypothetical protein
MQAITDKRMPHIVGINVKTRLADTNEPGFDTGELIP